MSLPTGPETSSPHTSMWRVEQVVVTRDGDGVELKIKDRFVRNGVVTDEYRDRKVTKEDAASQWKKKGLKKEIDEIHGKAKVR